MPPSKKDTDRIIKLLIKAYNAEIETVMNYIANSVNLDGIRAEHIKSSLAADVAEELGHAQTVAARIKVIEGTVPGSLDLKWSQKKMQPPAKSTDVVAVIKGVIAAEEDAIKGYEDIIEACNGVDPVTEDMAITILSDEQNHRSEFIGFLKEIEAR
jgi:bacterioferritin